MATDVVEKHKHASWLTIMAHAGYAARGVIYILIGALALMAAFGGGSGQTAGSKGALRQITELPGGKWILGFVAAGLVCFALWRFVQGGLDAEGKGNSGKGMAIRAGYIVSGVINLLLAFLAISILTGWSTGGGGGGGGAKDWTAKLMSRSYGQWIVGAIGVVIIGVGIGQFVRGYTASFLKNMEFGAHLRGRLLTICRVGLAARGISLALVGFFFVVAAVQQQPSEARGLGGALSTLLRQPFGPWLLGALALGLLAFSVYCFVQAGYRRIGRPRSPQQATPGVGEWSSAT